MSKFEKKLSDLSLEESMHRLISPDGGGNLRDDYVNPLKGLVEVPMPPSLQHAVSALPKMDLKHIQVYINRANAHADLLISSGKNPYNLEKRQIAAIHLYTQNFVVKGNKFYGELNRVLRSKRREEIKPYFQYLRLLLSGLKKIPETPMTVYRGVGLSAAKKFVQGQMIHWYEVTSCTRRLDVVENFVSGSSHKIIFIVESTTAHLVSQYSEFYNEDEAILRPGRLLKVAGSIKAPGGFQLIQLIEVTEIPSKDEELDDDDDDDNDDDNETEVDISVDEERDEGSDEDSEDEGGSSSASSTVPRKRKGRKRGRECGLYKALKSFESDDGKMSFNANDIVEVLQEVDGQYYGFNRSKWIVSKKKCDCNPRWFPSKLVQPNSGPIFACNCVSNKKGISLCATAKCGCNKRKHKCNSMCKCFAKGACFNA